MKTIKIYGCPGSGKTSYIVDWLNNHEEDRGNTLLLSFTVSAAETLKQRIRNTDKLDIRTLHSFATKELKLGPDMLMQGYDIKAIMLNAGFDFDLVDFKSAGEQLITTMDNKVSKMGNMICAHYALMRYLQLPIDVYYNSHTVPVDFISFQKAIGMLS